MKLLTYPKMGLLFRNSENQNRLNLIYMFDLFFYFFAKSLFSA